MEFETMEFKGVIDKNKRIWASTAYYDYDYDQSETVRVLPEIKHIGSAYRIKFTDPESFTHGQIVDEHTDSVVATFDENSTEILSNIEDQELLTLFNDVVEANIFHIDSPYTGRISEHPTLIDDYREVALRLLNHPYLQGDSYLRKDKFDLFTLTDGRDMLGGQYDSGEEFSPLWVEDALSGGSPSYTDIGLNGKPRNFKLYLEIGEDEKAEKLIDLHKRLSDPALFDNKFKHEEIVYDVDWELSDPTKDNPEVHTVYKLNKEVYKTSVVLSPDIDKDLYIKNRDFENKLISVINAATCQKYQNNVGDCEFSLGDSKIHFENDLYHIRVDDEFIARNMKLEYHNVPSSEPWSKEPRERTIRAPRQYIFEKINHEAVTPEFKKAVEDLYKQIENGKTIKFDFESSELVMDDLKGLGSQLQMI